jgi:hypothetical protein
MQDILEICQKCDMKNDMIDLHLSTTIVHEKYVILLIVASFSSFPWVLCIEILSATSTQVALLIVTVLSVACVLGAEISMRKLGGKQENE